jgi:hypothetical protein
VRLERFGERDHSAVDVVMLLAVVCLALVTWSYLGEAASVPLWKSYASVALAVLLALAALTRQPYWAISMRFLLGCWMRSLRHSGPIWRLASCLRQWHQFLAHPHCDLTHPLRLRTSVL